MCIRDRCKRIRVNEERCVSDGLKLVRVGESLGYSLRLWEYNIFLRLFLKKNSGRVNYERIIQRCSQSTSIYFTGRPSISDMVQGFADKYDKRLVKDYVNTQRGISDKMLIVKYLKYTFWVTLVTVFFCFALSIYLKIK